MSKDMRGLLIMVVSAIALSTMGIWGKFAIARGIEPANLVTLRAIIAFVVLGLALAIFRGGLPRMRKGHVFSFAVMGLLGLSVNYATFFMALEYTTVAVAISLFYTFPIFVMLGAVLFLGERFTLRKAVVMALALIGAVLVTGVYETSLSDLSVPGILLGLGAGLSKAFYTLSSKKMLEDYGPWDTTFFAFGFAALGLLGFTAAQGELSLQIDAIGWLIVVALAIVPTLIGYSLFVVALDYLEAGRASIIATLEPVLGIVLAAVVLSEVISISQLAGIALTLAGVTLLNLKSKSHQNADQGDLSAGLKET